MGTIARDDSTNPVLIRPVRIEDVEAIHLLRTQPLVINSTNALPSERLDHSRRNMESLGYDDHVLVAEIDGRVVGITGLHVKRGKQRHTGEVGMSVHDHFQGRGIGRKLLEALLSIADNHLGLVRVELEVLPDNERAIKLYESCGFVLEGRKRRAYYRGGSFQDILMMARIREAQPL